MVVGAVNELLETSAGGGASWRPPDREARDGPEPADDGAPGDGGTEPPKRTEEQAPAASAANRSR